MGLLYQLLFISEVEVTGDEFLPRRFADGYDTEKSNPFSVSTLPSRRLFSVK